MDRDHIDEMLSEWAHERPDLDVSAQGIVGRVLRLAKFYERELAATFHLFGLSGGDFDVLATIRRCGNVAGLPASQLARRCMLSAAAMTNRIDRLEMTALVKRVAEPTDRRVVRVKLTTKGRELIDRAFEAHVENQEMVVGCLSAFERMQLASLLRKAITDFEIDSVVLQSSDSLGREPKLDRNSIAGYPVKQDRRLELRDASKTDSTSPTGLENTPRSQE